MSLQYVRIACGFADKVTVIIAILSFLAFRIVSRVRWGKQRRNEIFSQKKISFCNYFIRDFVIQVNDCKYYFKKSYDSFVPFTNAERDVHRLVKDLLHQGDVFVDVGCNLGMYTIPSAKRVGPDGQVIAIDASPENVIMTKRNAELNGLANVTTLNLAISDSEGQSTFYLTEQGTSGTLVKSSKFGQTDRPLIVKTSTLDALVSSLDLTKEIQLIKIDVEGSEVECIRGAQHVLQQTKYMVIECHNMQNKKEIERIINDNFTINEVDYKPSSDTFHILCTKK